MALWIKMLFSTETAVCIIKLVHFKGLGLTLATIKLITKDKHLIGTTSAVCRAGFVWEQRPTMKRGQVSKTTAISMHQLKQKRRGGGGWKIWFCKRTNGFFKDHFATWLTQTEPITRRLTKHTDAERRHGCASDSCFVYTAGGNTRATADLRGWISSMLDLRFWQRSILRVLRSRMGYGVSIDLWQLALYKGRWYTVWILAPSLSNKATQSIWGCGELCRQLGVEERRQRQW